MSYLPQFLRPHLCEIGRLQRPHVLEVGHPRRGLRIEELGVGDITEITDTSSHRSFIKPKQIYIIQARISASRRLDCLCVYII